MITMVKNKKKYNSQFTKNCNTDWNVNHELICWINYWFREFKEKAQIYLDFHKYEYKGKVLTQEQVIDEIIELTNYIDQNYGEFDLSLIKKVEEKKNEMFDLLKLVWGDMWW